MIFAYEDILDNPTQATRITEPGTPESDWQSSTLPAVTTMSWFDGDDAPAPLPPDAWQGQLDRLTDPLGCSGSA